MAHRNAAKFGETLSDSAPARNFSYRILPALLPVTYSIHPQFKRIREAE
jgi:hypothetical protein